jgi:hypothetical protein
MTIIQGIIASGGATGSHNDFGWVADSDTWYANGNAIGSTTYSSPNPSANSYLYPDGSYTGATRTFTGGEWLISPNLSISNSWKNNAITINLWFYPTSTSIQLMSELGQLVVGNGYHYSIFDIDGGGYVHSTFYSNVGTQYFASSVPVDLNMWNHIYFTEDVGGNHKFALNNISTTNLPKYKRAKPDPQYFAIGGIDGTNSGASAYPFQGKVGWLNISDYVAKSTWANTVGKFRP